MPRNILIVDDHQGNLDIAQEIIQQDGVDITTTICGVEATKILNEKNVDLLILDLIMPNISGFEVLNMIKEFKRAKKIPVIMMSSIDDVSIIKQAYERGAIDFFVKPLDARLFKKRVNYLLNNY